MKEFFKTSNVTGSSCSTELLVMISLRPYRDDDVEIFVDRGGHPGRHDDGRVDLLDDGRASDAETRRQLLALVDRSVPGFRLEPDLPADEWNLALRVGRVDRQFRLRNEADRLEP